MDDKILITKEDGSEVEMTILLTYENDGRNYVLYYDENDDSGEVLPFYYNESDHSLHELETEQEWEVANEILEAFIEEEE